MPTNYDVSESRLFSNLESSRRKANALLQYNDLITSQLTGGFIEQVISPEWRNGTLLYIHHHGVLNYPKTTQLRIVFDCSARESVDSPSVVKNIIIIITIINIECAILNVPVQNVQ